MRIETPGLEKYIPETLDFPDIDLLYGIKGGGGGATLLMGVTTTKQQTIIGSISIQPVPLCCGVAMATHPLWGGPLNKDTRTAFRGFVQWAFSLQKVPIIGFWPTSDKATLKAYKSGYYGTKGFPYNWKYDELCSMGTVLAETRNPMHGNTFIRTVMHFPEGMEEYIQDLDKHHGLLFSQWQVIKTQKKEAK